MATSDRQYKVRLSDGTVVEVTPKTMSGLITLRDAFDNVARGKTPTFLLVEQAGDASVSVNAFSQDLAHVGALSDELVKISARLRRVSSLWEGNAPPSNRSARDN